MRRSASVVKLLREGKEEAAAAAIRNLAAANADNKVKLMELGSAVAAKASVSGYACK